MSSLPRSFFTRKVAFLALICVFLALTIRPLFAASIVLPDGSTFDIELVSHGGGSYTYQVSEVSGKDLSHWLLEFGLCAEHLVGAEPAGYETGIDGSTGRTGVKWNVSGSFTSGLFTIQLDADYPVGPVTVVAKAGNAHATATVDGPVCDAQPPQDPEPPTATPTQPGGTIPPPTDTPLPTATQPSGTIPPPTSTPGNQETPTDGPTTQPPTATPATGTPTAPPATATPPATVPPTATGTPPPPTATSQPPATATVEPTVVAPTPTPGAPTNEEEGPEPTPGPEMWYYWLPAVQHQVAQSAIHCAPGECAP